MSDELRLKVTEFLNSFGIKNLDIFDHIVAAYKVGRIYYVMSYEYLGDSTYSQYSALLRKIISAECDSDVSLALKLPALKEVISRLYEEDDFPENSFEILGMQPKDIEVMSKLFKDFRKSKIDMEAMRQASSAYYDKFNEFLRRKIIFEGKEYSINEFETHIEDMIAEDPAKSIDPLAELEPIYNWFQKMRGVEICISIKIDGINLRCFYVNGELVRICTRGRSTGVVKDYTYAVSRKVPWHLELDGEPFTGIIRGEAYGQLDKLSHLKNMYAADYVVPRTAATTMCTTPHSEEDYAYLHYTTFNNTINGNLSDKIDEMEAQGFETVPYTLVVWDGGTIEEFKEWIDELVSNLHQVSSMCGIKSDGAVAEVNSKDVYEKFVADGMYDAGNIALKIGPWGPDVYESVVEHIKVARKSSGFEYSVKASIRPVKVESGITISTINLFNMGLVTAHNLQKGDPIRFIFKNDNASEWLY